MKIPFGLTLVGLAVVALAGCSSPGAPVTGCPEPPEVSFSEDTDMMEAVAAETDRFANDLIGMAEAEAMQCVEEADLIWRVYEQDGEQFALTMDYRVERVNVKIERGIVTDAYSG